MIFGRYSTLLRILLICMFASCCVWPGMAVDVWMYPDYPDMQEITVREGSVTYTLNANGTHRRQEGDRSTTTSVSIMASQHLQSTGTATTTRIRLNGKVVEHIVDKTAKSTTTSIQTLSCNDGDTSTHDAGIFGQTVTVGKKQGVVCFQLPHSMVGPMWEITEVDVKTQWKEVTPEETQSGNDQSTGSLIARLPYHGGGGATRFSIGARRAEGTGKDNGELLIGGAIVEEPWKNGRSSGSFSVPVQISVGGGYLCAETVPVWKEKFATGGHDESETIISGTLTVQWFIGERPSTQKLLMAPVDKKAYDSWIPAPEADNPQKEDYGTHTPLEVRATITPIKPGAPAPVGRIEFRLTDVSEHTGRCLNYPHDMGSKRDLRFAAVQPDGVQVDPNNPCRAYTTNRVSEAVVAIEALDSAAYGKLTASCDELALDGEDEATQYRFLRIPRDDNENLVADGWERQIGVFGEQYPTDWDEETVDGQTEAGDGLSFYREYRGVMTPEQGILRLKRLTPKKKELFVLDADTALNVALWEQASKITAIRLREDLVMGGTHPEGSRIVDFHMPGGVEAQHKFAVRIEVVRGMDDRPLPDGNVNPNQNAYGYCYSDNTTPRNATVIRLFPDRLRKYLIDNAAKMLERAVKDPQSQEAQNLETAGIPNWLARRALERLGEGSREKLVQQMLTISAIHEVGHACGLPGHTINGEDGKLQESSEGDATCPMRYPDGWDNYNLTILQVLFKSDADLPLQNRIFCRDEVYNCFSRLNVRD